MAMANLIVILSILWSSLHQLKASPNFSKRYGIYDYTDAETLRRDRLMENEDVNLGTSQYVNGIFEPEWFVHDVMNSVSSPSAYTGGHNYLAQHYGFLAKGYCSMGMMTAPSGKKVCFANRIQTVPKPDPEGQTECQAKGFTGLFEPRTADDVKFMHETFLYLTGYPKAGTGPEGRPSLPSRVSNWDNNYYFYVGISAASTSFKHFWLTDPKDAIDRSIIPLWNGVACTAPNCFVSIMDYADVVYTWPFYGNTNYKFVCELKTTPGSQAVGKGMFYYQKSPCGLNVSLPTNLKLEDLDVTTPGTSTDIGFANYLFGCSLVTDATIPTLIENDLTLPKMVKLKRSHITFHHACGTSDSNGQPCSMKLITLKDGNSSEIAEITRLFNNGSMYNLKAWPWEDLKLPVIQPESKLQFLSRFDPDFGSANLDNIHFYTPQKCMPKWSIMRRSKFKRDSQSTVNLFPVDVETMHLAGLSYSHFDARYTSQYANRFTAKNIEHCARLCLLSRSCDMFEFSVSSTTCSFYATAQQKLSNIQDIIEPTAPGEDYRIYILHCSTSLENWIANPDPFTHSREPWSIKSTCSDFKIAENKGFSHSNRHSINSGYQYTSYIACDQGQRFQMEQVITEWPYGIDKAYFTLVKPQGVLRYWMKSKSGRNKKIFKLEVSVAFVQGTTENAKAGSQEDIDEGSIAYGSTKERIIRLPDLSSFDFDKIIVTVDLQNPDNDGTSLYLGPFDVLIDVPFDAGCYKVLSGLSGKISDEADAITPAWCITKCLQSSDTKRFALLQNGMDCFCYENLPLAQLQLVPPENETVSCSIGCKGTNNSYLCGGPSAVSVYIGKCPSNQKRFGDSCFEQLTLPSASLYANADECLERGGLLWYPETSLELEFVTQTYPIPSGSIYHIGYKNFSKNMGMTFLDGSQSPGIPGFTQKQLDNADTFGPGPIEDLMSPTSCITLDPEKENDKAFTHENKICPDGKGICKFRLISSHEPIKNNVDYLTVSSAKDENPTDFNGEGTVRIKLLPDVFVAKRFIEITFSSQIVISGLKFEMPDSKALRKFTLLVEEAGISYPDTFTHWGVHTLNYGNLPLPATPKVLKRLAHFQPIAADRIRLEVEDGANEIDLKIEILGIPNRKVHGMNPIQEPINYETSYYSSNSYDLKDYVSNYGFCPSGSIKLSTRPTIDIDAYPSWKVTAFTLYLTNSKTPEYTWGLRFEFNPSSLIEVDSTGYVELSKITNVPTLENGKTANFEIFCTQDSLKIFVNGAFIASSSTFHQQSGGIPTIKEIKLTQTYPTSYFTFSSMTTSYIPPFGIIDVFKQVQNPSPAKRPEPYIYGSYGYPVNMKKNFALLNIYEKGVAPKQNETIYMPVQAAQHCFINQHGGVQCKLHQAIYNKNYLSSGFGGADGGKYAVQCRAGYSAVGKVCLVLPIGSDQVIAKASLDCSDQGATLYAPIDQIQNTIMAGLMQKWGIDEMWIDVRRENGVWKSKGKTLNGFKADWASGEPRNTSGLDCAIVSKSAGFAMKAENCKTPKKYFCMAQKPDCPEGFTWLPSYNQGRSCFKIAGPTFNEFNAANKKCLKEKTRLATPMTATDLQALSQWIPSSGSLASNGGKYADVIADFSLGMFQTINANQKFLFVDRSAIIDWANFTALWSTSNTYYAKIVLNYGLSPSYGSYSRSTSYTSSQAICEYTECSTSAGTNCRYPFKYKGRMYDTCITIDGKGTAPGTPWCSTAIDELQNSIAGSEQTCTATCQRITNCPVGFLPMYPDNTCYQDSSSTTFDVVQSFAAAEAKCAEQGARLFKIRSTASIEHLKKTRAEYFVNSDYIPSQTNSMVAIDLKFMKLDADASRKLYYSDMSPVDPQLAKLLVWKTGYPVDDPTFTCIALFKLELINVPCGDENYYFGNVVNAVDTPTLGYLCEARVNKAINSPESCSFPFIYQGEKFTSCALKTVPGFNPAGKPWCATLTDQNSLVVPGKWILCEDEREIIYDGDGAGYQCPMPFIFNRIYFDYCTKLKPSGAVGFAQDYWCPDPKSVGINNVYTTSQPVGKCTEFLHPPENGCAELYEPISDKICVRTSSYKETYEAAQAKCKSEGGFLLYDINAIIHSGLEALLREKYVKYARFKDATGFWMDADFSATSRWKWRNHPQAFKEFTRWDGGIEEIGCSPSAGCSETDGILFSAFYDAAKDNVAGSWIAKDKFLEQPYVCMAKCPRYYTWFPNAGKCLKVVNVKESKTIGDAMVQCSIDNGRLVSLKSCATIKALMDELLLLKGLVNQTYFFGTFAFKSGKGSSYRNWEDSSIIDALGNGVFDLEPSGGSLCNFGPLDSLSTSNGAESFMALRIETAAQLQLEITEFNINDYTLPRKKAGYICEKEELWGCPEGYIMNQGHCYKLFRNGMDYIDALFQCQEDKGVLATPQTFTQAEFLESYVSHMDRVENITDQEKKILLGFRLEDIDDGSYFQKLDGHGLGTYATQDGDCVVMSMDSSGVHQGWERQQCNIPSPFICQLNETLSTKFIPYVKGPTAILPLNKNIAAKNVIGSDVATKVQNVGWDTLWAPSYQLGSPMFSKKLAHSSYITADLSSKLADLKAFTILLWVRPSSKTPGVALSATHNGFSFKLQIGETVEVIYKDSLTEDRFASIDANKLAIKKWNFVGVTIDATSHQNTIFVNEGYGFDGTSININGRLKFHSLSTYDWIPEIFQSPVILGSDEAASSLDPFDGSISCIQFYNYALDPATVHLKKFCPDVPGANSHKQCLPGYVFFQDQCYKVSLSISTFAQAESFCMPDLDSSYESQLMFTTNPKHWDYVARLVEDQIGATSYWAGISDRDEDGYFITSHGENMTSLSNFFATPGDQASTCGVVNKGTNGYLTTGYCLDKKPFVCSMRPLYAKPDYHCPSGFYPYRGTCLYPSRKSVFYEDAVVECSKVGSILLPVKDIELYEFLKIWASGEVGADTWLGVRKFKWNQFYDDDGSLPQPLQETITTDLTYSDGSPFDPDTQFNFGLKKFDTDCYYFKQSAEFELRGSSCTKERSFVCLWKEYDCPAGYSYIGQISDGRTCHGTPSSATDNFYDATCHSNNDYLRERWTPETPYFLDRFRRLHAMDMSVWTDASMDPQGDWFYNFEFSMPTAQFSDMRHSVEGTWVPPLSILDVNGTTDGCLEITSNGLLNTRIKSECDTIQPTACKYTACLTTQGKKCLFPFRYHNDSNPDLTYKICSSLDVYRPWCPTKLDANLNVLEWGDCLEDCPKEPVMSVCLEEPEFPISSDGSDHSVNYTSSYEKGSKVVTDELDYVAFTCPLGYVFQGTNNITHYALCHNWEFIYLYDPEVVCIPVECPPAPTFQPNTTVGETTWDADTDLPIYGAVAQYSCPEGYVFQIYQDFPDPDINFGLVENETAVINITCAAFGDWSPKQVPKCIPKNCTTPPVAVPENDKGMSNWNNVSQSYGTKIRYYCPKNGWGFPSNGLSEVFNECQADKTWTLEEVETCVLLPCPKMPPAKPEGGWFWYGLENARYKCPNGYQFEKGNYPYWYSNCTVAKTWEPLEAEKCISRKCVTEPPEPFLGIDLIWPNKNRQLGSMLTYVCPYRKGTHLQQLKNQYVHCKWDKDTDNMVWWPPYIEECNSTIPPPDDVVVLKTLPPYSVKYEDTNDYYWPLISTKDDTSYVNSKGKVEPLADTRGPFGFGDAIQLKDNKCIVKSNFGKRGDKCILNPKECKNGISVSIWEKVAYREDVLNVQKSHARKYVLSTGGDFNASDGRVYPGLAIYHEGMDLIAVVSTDRDVWQLRVRGQLLNQTWSNIGITWEPYRDDPALPYATRGGLELYVNAEKVGHAIKPLDRPPLTGWEPRPTLLPVYTEPSWRKVATTPPIAMVGCHRNADMNGYADFCRPGTAYDELTIWTRKLQVNRTHNEVLYFTAGYDPQFEGLTLDKWNEMLDRVELQDPGQMEMAGIVSAQFSAQAKELAGADLAAPVIVSLDNGNAASNSGKVYPRTPQEQADYDRENLEYESSRKLLNFDGLKLLEKPRYLPKRWSVLPTASLPLEDTEDNRAGWDSIVLDPDEEGASKLVKRIEKYAMYYLNSADLREEEDFPGYYDASEKMMMFHSHSNAVTMTAMKMYPATLERYGPRINLRDFASNNTVKNFTHWSDHREFLEIPSTIKFNNESLCGNKALTILTAIYNGYGKMGPLLRNPQSIRAREMKLDSKPVSVQLMVSPNVNKLEQDLSSCKLDPEQMRYMPITIRFYHYDHQTSLRKLLWHEDDLDTNIEVRKCVVYNEAIGRYGAWEADKCTTVLSEQLSTVCECYTTGTFALIAEMVQAPEYGPEYDWLWAVKYVGYTLSILILVVFVAVVFVNTGLWEMFHIIRLNSAFCCLVALVSMFVAESDSIRKDRHDNITISVFQQFWFLAFCLSLLAESFATFRAITGGIIGGKTWGYIPMIYGWPMIDVGATMYLYGEDYGRDPRAFIGWYNETKMIFFYGMLIAAALSVLLCFVIVFNISTPKTRKDSVVEQLSSQGTGLTIMVMIFGMTWGFALPAYMQFPDKEMPDFFPIFQVLNAWSGVFVMAFLGMSSRRFRAGLFGDDTTKGSPLLKYMTSSKRRRRHRMAFGALFGDSGSAMSSRSVSMSSLPSGPDSLDEDIEKGDDGDYDSADSLDNDEVELSDNEGKAQAKA